MNFTEKHRKELFNILKEKEMKVFEPERVIAELEQHNMEKQKKSLLLKKQQLIPFVKEKETEWKIVDAEYLVI